MKKEDNTLHGPGYFIDAALDPPAVHITGGRTLLIEGCKGITDFSQNRLSLDMGRHIVTITGSSLEIEEFSASQMTLRCDVASVSFDLKAVRNGD